MNESSRRERDKLRREQEIIDVAEKLFCEKGFDNTSMNILAAASELTKRTLYQYFVNKEDLFFAVILRGYQNLWANVKQAINTEDTGYEKIKCAYSAFLNYSFSNPGLLALMGSLSFVNDKSVESNSPYRKKFFEYNDLLFAEIYEIFACGAKDGTLRTDIDVKTLMFSSIFMVTGFFHMYQTSGKNYLEQSKIDEPDFIKTTFQMLLDSIRL